MESLTRSNDKPVKTRPHYISAYSEARELQLLILNDAKDPTLKPFVRAQLARAYKELTELRLRLIGKGPPKAVDYSVKRKKPSARSGFADLPAEQKQPIEPAKPAE